jgi:hypothetical protein
MSKSFYMMNLNPSAVSIVEGIGLYQLEDLEQAIHARKNELMASALISSGIPARWMTDAGGEKNVFGLICVYDPSGELPGEWATLDECKKLLNTVANLKPDLAFRRWREKIEALTEEPYTHADAIRDIKNERAELEKKYNDGRIDHETYRLGHAQARDYLGYVSDAARTLGKLGGSATSEIKKKSSAKNGRLGGRPKATK